MKLFFIQSRLKKVLAVCLACLTVVSFNSSILAMNIEEASEPNAQIKNVIVMIPDGMSVGALTLARWYKSYDAVTKKVVTTEKLALDEMASGLVRTYWVADGVVGAITDSAPAATAFATGIKTNDKYVGSSPSKMPIASILEAAHKEGIATGIIATSNIQHATPADYSGHYFDRSRYDIIGEQQVYAGMDVVLGGGSKYLATPYRKDNENLINAIRNEGYTYVTDKSGLNSVTSGKLWGMFATDAMAYNMDIKENQPTQPTLAEMTSKSIELLSQDEDGFFLMVEGSKVDWAAHANDPIGVISDVLAFDDAVKIALDYAKKHQDTMVLCLTDHGNGGITIGNIDTSSSYSKDPVGKFIAPLKAATLTGEGLENKLNEDRTNIKEAISTYFGIVDLTIEEEAAIKVAKAGTLNSVVGPMISKRAYIGWTTTGHTGEDVVLFSYLPGDQRITGLLENTDIAKVCAGVLELDLEATTKEMYIDATTAFKAKGATVTVNLDNPANPKLVVTKGTTTIVIPENKNYVIVNGMQWSISSVNVNIAETFYVPQEVIDMIN